MSARAGIDPDLCGPGGTPARGAKPLSQRRALATLNRIIEAAEHMLERRGFDDISVLDICIEANVSISSFYCRFPDKAALLECLHDRHLASERAQFALLIDALTAADLDLRKTLRSFARSYIAYQRGASLARQTMRRAEAASPKLAEHRAASDRLMMDSIVTLLAVRAGTLDPETFQRRASFALSVVRAGVLDAIHTPASFTEEIGVEDEMLAEWTVDLVDLFLQDANGDLPSGRPSAQSPASSA